MKTRLTWHMAVILLIAGLAIAQTSEVSSVNAVGYIKKPLQANRWHHMGVQFDCMTTTNPTIGDILGTEGLPDLLTVSLFRGNRYVSEVYLEGWGWDPATNIIDRGEGFWIWSPVDCTVTMTGEVPPDDTPLYLRSGYSIVTYPYPVSVPITATVFNTSVPDNSTISVFDPASNRYTSYSYIEGWGWDPADLQFTEGMGFWFYSVTPTNFVETVPYSL